MVNNKFYNQQWYLRLAKVPEAWQLLNGGNSTVNGLAGEIAFGSASINIAMLDAGIESTPDLVPVHPAFQGALTDNDDKVPHFIVLSGTGRFSFSNLIYGRHGVLTAGMAAAKAQVNNVAAYSGVGVVGVAPNCKVVSVSQRFTSDFTVFRDLAGLRQFFIKRDFAGRKKVNGLLGYPSIYDVVVSPRKSDDPHQNAYLADLVNQTADIFSMSIQAPVDESTNKVEAFATLVFDDLTFFGRKGRGCVLVVASGNNGQVLEVTAGQYRNEYATSNKPIVVGATRVSNHYNHLVAGSNPEESVATYSNFGERLDIVAPAGGVASGFDRRRSYTTTVWGAGQLSSESPLELTVVAGVSDTELELRNLHGVFPGQHVGLGNPATIQFDVCEIKAINATNNHITIAPLHNVTSPTALNGTKASLSPLHTQTTQAATGANQVRVRSIRGAYAGGQVRIGILGDAAATTNGNSYLISQVDVATKDISVTTMTGGVANLNYPVGTQVVFAPKTANVIGRAGVTVNSVARTIEVSRITLDHIEGLFVGGYVRVVSTTDIEFSRGNIREIIPGAVAGGRQTGTIVFELPLRVRYAAGAVVNNAAAVIEVAKVKTLGFGDINPGFLGTSAATPIVSGVTALMLSAKPTLNALEVKAMIKETADKINVGITGAGAWKDSKGALVSNFSDGASTTLQTAASRGALSIEIVSGVGFDAKHAISIGSSSNVIERVAGNVIFLQYPLWVAQPAGVAVREKRIPAHSDYYGAGRVNAQKAVQAALSYNHAWRKIKIRDSLTTGEPINSPDVWLRPVTDPVVTTQPLESGIPLHQQPRVNEEQLVYVRVINEGNRLPSLKGLTVRCLMAFTNDVNVNLPFPEKWIYQQDRATGENIILLDMKELELEIPANNAVNPANRTTWNEHIVTLNWNPTQQRLNNQGNLENNPAVFSKINPQNLHAYLLVHIAPFDGPDNEVSLTNIAQNKQLTYKPIVPFYAQFRDDTNLHLQKPHPIEVPLDGRTVSEAFKVQVFGVRQNQLTNTYLRFTLIKADGTPNEVVDFKDEGGIWGYAPNGVPAWFAAQAPVVTNVHMAEYRNVSFECGLLVNKQHSRVTVEVIQEPSAGNVIVATQEFQLGMPAHLPQGIQQSKTQVLHTFTDFSTLTAQTAAQAYGPIMGSPTTHFNTAALFGSTQAQKAYAVTGGIAFIQEVAGTQKVNLVLKPDEQPIHNGVVVKYFVYRGLRRNAFLASNGSLLPANQVSDNELLKRMWQVKNEWNQQEQERKQALSPPQTHTTQGLVREDIGLATEATNQLPASESIDKVFAEHTFQPIVEGWSIGEFDVSGDFGFEVMIDYPGHTHTLAEVRALTHVVQANTLTNSEIATDTLGEFDTLYAREKVLGYIDPAAYYGLFYQNKLKNHVGDAVVVIQSGDIKTLVIDKFFTKDSLYLDIRNELGSSLNLYTTYKGTGSNYPQIQLNGASMPYEYHGWPIVRVPIIGNAPTELGCQLPIGNNSHPILHLVSGAYQTSGNASSTTARLQFKLLASATGANTTQEFLLQAPKQGNHIFPFYFRITYSKRYSTPDAIDAVINQGAMNKIARYDAIFPFGQIPLYPVPNATVWNSSSYLKYLGLTSLSSEGQDFNLQLGAAQDTIGETVYGVVKLPSEVGGVDAYNTFTYPLGLEGGKNNQPTILHHLTSLNVLAAVTTETDVGLAGVQLLKLGVPTGNASLQATMANFYSVSYTTAEANALRAAAEVFVTGYPVYFMFQEGTYGTEVTNKFKLALQGIVKSTEGVYQTQVVAPDTDIWCYAFKENSKNFFTNAYATAYGQL
ncbi:S8 family serine peptidase [Microscilla marina]|uniref:Peptidase S8/S53 domain-containing protein n=1 Tax=Microscilla marina ATCC 23134 TaxID=313606 RepID=A1ZZL3_MICM2|nr:S8 family serine peptidase [Microscilla marina]EAY24167.1 hypothetical protein M23134_00898 [Microscilla marina ATCC 23134]